MADKIHTPQLVVVVVVVGDVVRDTVRACLAYINNLRGTPRRMAIDLFADRLLIYVVFRADRVAHAEHTANPQILMHVLRVEIRVEQIYVKVCAERIDLYTDQDKCGLIGKINRMDEWKRFITPFPYWRH